MSASKKAAENSVQSAAKRARKTINLDTKMLVIQRMEAGEKRANICKSLNLAPATVTTIMANADKIKESMQKMIKFKGSHVSYTRSSTMEMMEQLLALWMDDLKQQGIPLTEKAIATKAKSLFDYIQREKGGTETFAASKGWFARFKQRSQIHNVKGEAEADAEAARAFPQFFQKIIDDNNLQPDLVFNVDETGLYWKRMPSRTYIAREEISGAGFTAAKDRVTLLLGGNASGTVKLKPLLVYHSETPRVMRGMIKSHLPVIWKSNRNAWVTQEIFAEWYTTQFCPSVLKFCHENNLPRKALLLLDDAPGHPPNLAEISSELDVKVVYLPPRTTALVQPMNQAIAAFKANYLRKTFRDMIHETDTSGITLRHYWNEYNILKAVNNISVAWNEVTVSCMRGAWHEIWPYDLGRVKDEEAVVTNELTELAKQVGLDNVEPEDIIELLQSHTQPLSTEEVEELGQQSSEQQDTEDESMIKSMQTKDLQDILAAIDSATRRLCDIDPDWERSSTVTRGITAMLGPYHEILQERKKHSKQSTLHSFLKANEPQPGPSSQK